MIFDFHLNFTFISLVSKGLKRAVIAPVSKEHGKFILFARFVFVYLSGLA